jgi:hypothetical protein
LNLHVADSQVCIGANRTGIERQMSHRIVAQSESLHGA